MTMGDPAGKQPLSMMQTPLSHRAPVGQAPHTKVPPQPLLTLSHRPLHDVTGVHPHTLGVPPPPHVSGDVHVPQLRFVPQPFDSEPQLSPTFAQVVVGLHPQTFGAPEPPHESGAAQVPQLSVPPQPFAIEPQFFPCWEHVVGVHPQT
jgi:hypothetical protein